MTKFVALAGGMLLLVAASALLHGQAPDQKQLAFEVASIKPNRSNDLTRHFEVQGDELRMVNMPLRNLIWEAYGSQMIQLNSQIIGGPTWITSDRFDVIAKTGEVFSASAALPERAKLMLQHLLEDRFRLTVHSERRVFSIFVLALSSNQSKLGPRLHRYDCGTSLPDNDDPHRGCGRFNLSPGHQTGQGVTMEALARVLSGYWLIRRPVIDRTGLSGTFSFDLEFAPAFNSTRQDGTAPAPNPQSASGPSVFTALHEQLGLKLEPTKGLVDVLVIDHVERPTPD